MSRDRTYNIWYNMKRRCTDPQHMRYKDYGLRGISYDAHWEKFDNFLTDMGVCPANLTLERKNNKLGYSKNNCTWATRKEQAFNQRVRSDNPHGVRGVSFHTLRQKWRAYGKFHGFVEQLYYGPSYEEAVKARKAWEQKNGIA